MRLTSTRLPKWAIRIIIMVILLFGSWMTLNGQLSMSLADDFARRGETLAKGLLPAGTGPITFSPSNPEEPQLTQAELRRIVGESYIEMAPQMRSEGVKQRTSGLAIIGLGLLILLVYSRTGNSARKPIDGHPSETSL